MVDFQKVERLGQWHLVKTARSLRAMVGMCRILYFHLFYSIDFYSIDKE